MRKHFSSGMYDSHMYRYLPQRKRDTHRGTVFLTWAVAQVPLKQPREAASDSNLVFLLLLTIKMPPSVCLTFQLTVKNYCWFFEIKDNRKF